MIKNVKNIKIFFIFLTLLFVPDFSYEKEKKVHYIINDKDNNEYESKKCQTYIFKAIVSVYHATKSQTDETPLITASNNFIDTTKIEKLRYCAVNRKMFNKQGGIISFYDTLIIISKNVPEKYLGKWVVVDKMAKKIDTTQKRKHYPLKVDLLIHKDSQKGLWKNVDVVLIKRKK